MRNDSPVSVILRLTLLGVVSLVTMGAQSSCSSSDGDGRWVIEDPPASGNGPTFTTTLVLKNSAGTVTDRFQRGELITMELAVRNRTQETVRVQFNDGAQSDFAVFNDGTHQLRWRWTEGKAFIQVATDLVFRPGETITTQVTWDQVLASGGMLEAGSYEARGLLMKTGRNPDLQAPDETASTLVNFTITR